MIGHGNRGVGTVPRKVMILSYITEKFEYESICSKLPAEHTAMYKLYLINLSENMCIRGSDMERIQSIWMQLRFET
jgi:hypothetical protein